MCALFAAVYLIPAAAQEAEPAAAAAESMSSAQEAESAAAAADPGAAPAEEAPEELTGPALTEFITRLEAQLTLRDLLDHGEYSAAVPVAARLFELTEEEFGERSTESAVAVSNLAETQRRARLYEDSERNFLTAVELFRETGGNLTDSVITPLVGLGATYQAMDQHPQAITAFQEARTINRRVHGLLNEDQIDILDHIARSLVSMDLYEDAEEQKMTALRIMERAYGEQSLEILPTLYDHALWFRSIYRFQQERDYYGRAMAIVRGRQDNQSPLLVQPLRQIGNSFRVQKLPEGRGIGSLRRALEILQAQSEPDTVEMARVLRDIGDWQVAFSKIGPTGAEYRQAWALLNEVEDGEALQRRWFREPDYVLHEHPSTRGLVDPGEPGAQPGHVLVTFDVLPSGRTANIAVLESVPPGLKDDSSIRSIARSRFRPRMIDGEPVLAEGVARDFTFYYAPKAAEEE